MSTRIDIINAVLARCGSSTVATDQDTADSRTVAANYGPCRDFVIEDREWTFASDLVVLAQDANPPPFFYSYAYIIPSGVLRVVRVYANPFNDPPVQSDDWVRKGGRVLSNQVGVLINQPGIPGPLYAEVLTRVDEGQFSPGMVQALIEYIISVSAVALTENAALAKNAAEAYLVKVSDAAAMDGSQGRTKQLIPPTLPGRRQHVIR